MLTMSAAVNVGSNKIPEGSFQLGISVSSAKKSGSALDRTVGLWAVALA